jgi:excisionase family DNA binding protein
MRESFDAAGRRTRTEVDEIDVQCTQKSASPQGGGLSMADDQTTRSFLECPPGDGAVSEPAREQIKTAEPAYLTALQVADLVQVDEKTVLRWSLQDGTMPVLRRGRVVRFPRERLLAWLERQEPRGARRSARSAQAPPPAA